MNDEETRPWEEWSGRVGDGARLRWSRLSSRPEHISRVVEGSLARLKVEAIDRPPDASDLLELS